MPFVLDSFSLLAHFEDEAGAGRVREVLARCQAGIDRGYISLINVGETLSIAEREHGTTGAARVLGLIDQLPLIQVPPTRPRVLAAARIKARMPISHADAFAVAAASEFSATILTGDPGFRAAETEVSVELLPRQ